MAKTKTIRVSEEELAALQALRAGTKVAESRVVEAAVETEPVSTGTVSADTLAAQKSLADAFVKAIEQTRPPPKITIANRKPQTPWTPKDGTAKLKMKRKFYHHGILIADFVTNEEIALLNQLKPGHYCEGFVRVTLRKDRGIDIEHPIRTASQRLKLVNQYGIRSFTELLQRVIDEKNNPTKYRKPEDADLYDLE